MSTNNGPIKDAKALLFSELPALTQADLKKYKKVIKEVDNRESLGIIDENKQNLSGSQLTYMVKEKPSKK